MSALLSLLKEGKGQGWSWANYFHLPFCPCFSCRGAGNAQEESEDLGSSPGSGTYYLCDFGKKKAPMTTPLSSVEEVMASHGDPLGQHSSFTNLLGLGTNVKDSL